MAKVGVADVRSIVDRVCARPEILDACRKRNLGYVLKVLGENGLTQGKMSALTGKPQGRISEWIRGIRAPEHLSVIDDVATGLGFPAAARKALGLSGELSSGSIILVPPASTSLGTGLVLPESVAATTDTVTGLWRGDLEDPTASQQRRVDPRAWGDASLKWLVAPPPTAVSSSVGQVRIGMADIDRFRATVPLFDQLDDRFGGGHARSALVQYLATDAERLLRGRFTDDVGRELFSAVGEATLLAAWMTYDSAPGSGLAQRYFVQALALAKAADDKLLGGSILDAMSHQATYTGRYTDAANLARAARTGTNQLATPTLTAHFHTMEARALARLGDSKACDHAMAEAVRIFDQRNPDNDPEWIRYVNDTEMNAELGHCMRDLGRARDATMHATDGFLTAPDAPTLGRSDFFVAMVLADAHLADGHPEQACAIALKAVHAGEQLRSARCIGYLREFNKHLIQANNREVAEFQEAAAESRLWRIAARPATGGR